MSVPLTRARLNALDPSRLGSLARALQAHAAKREPEQTQFPARIRHPGGGEEWTGQASDAAQAKAQCVGKTFGAWHDKLVDCAAQCQQAEGHLDTAASKARGKIAETEAQSVGMDVAGRHWSCGEPFEVSDDFTVHVKPGEIPQGAPWEVGDVLNHMAAEHAQDIARAVAELRQVSDTWGGKIKTALDLSQLALDSHGQPYTAYDPTNTVHEQAAAIADGRMDVPDNPYVLNHLWQQLSPDEKNAIYDRHHDIGNHGGIPFDPPDHLGRDHYNKQHLGELTQQKQTEIDQARAQRPDWTAGHPPPAMSGRFENQERIAWKQWQDHVNALQHQLDGYKSIQATLDKSRSPGQPPRFLGIIDDKGRVSVSINNPDHAKQNATFVPGTGTETSSIVGNDDRSARMYRSALDQAGGTLGPNDVSVTTWQGYDAPPDLPHAALKSYALEGADALDRWQDGIRASHVGDPAYNTVIGHSYGTTEVGAAATGGHHLDANAVVAVASPGMLTDSAHGLSLDDGAKVFAAKTSNDPINIANAGSVIGLNQLGNDPVDWGDAYKFDAAAGGSWYSGDAHQAYFERGNPALDNLGKIIDGKDGNSGVTPRG